MGDRGWYLVNVQRVGSRGACVAKGQVKDRSEDGAAPSRSGACRVVATLQYLDRGSTGLVEGCMALKHSPGANTGVTAVTSAQQRTHTKVPTHAHFPVGAPISERPSGTREGSRT